MRVALKVSGGCGLKPRAAPSEGLQQSYERLLRQVQTQPWRLSSVRIPDWVGLCLVGRGWQCESMSPGVAGRAEKKEGKEVKATS